MASTTLRTGGPTAGCGPREHRHSSRPGGRISRGVAIGLRVLLAAGFATTLATVAGAEVYKWVDEQGRVQYGDQPPAGAPSERMEMPARDPATGTDAGEERRIRLLRQADDVAAQRLERRRTARAARAAEDRLAAEQFGDCVAARKQLDVLREQLPVYRDAEGRFRVKTLEDVYAGEREYLDDESRAVQLARTRAAIAELCAAPDDPMEQARARALQIQDERCEAAAYDLRRLERPDARTTRDDLERQRYAVRVFCGY